VSVPERAVVELNRAAEVARTEDRREQFTDHQRVVYRDWWIAQAEDIDRDQPAPMRDRGRRWALDMADAWHDGTRQLKLELVDVEGAP
jgi:hypothetical protein